jgi:hypothetical protein
MSIFVSGTATAYDESGNDIVQGCEAAAAFRFPTANLSSTTVSNGWVCLGEVQATEYMMQIHHDLCLPSVNVTVGQSMRVATKYMEDHPAELEEKFPELIFRAFREAWPCPK